MTRERIQELLAARPFRPFEIHVADGEVLRVQHSELMWMHPGGRTLVVATGPRDEDRIAIVDVLLVTKLVTSNGRNGRKKRAN